MIETSNEVVIQEIVPAVEVAAATVAEPVIDVSIESLESALGYVFADRSGLELALTHKSFANEQGTNAGDNERLEFLGDAVLDLAMSEILMRRFPTDLEGGLSKKRASLVNEETLAKVAMGLDMGARVRVGRGEAKTGGGHKPRLLASTLEAIFGAVFLDGGYFAAQAVVAKLFEERMTQLANSTVDFQADFKTRLQELAQERHRQAPVYRVDRESGPDHDKVFEVTVRVGETELASGSGRSKKSAEQDAAKAALEKMG
jgi:ribonuclease-3